MLAADHFEHRFFIFVFQIIFTEYFEQKRAKNRAPNPDYKTFGTQGPVSPGPRMVSDLEFCVFNTICQRIIWY